MSGEENQISGKWNEIKGEIQKKWGELTENDYQSVKGNLVSLGGILEQKFGIAKDKASAYVEELKERYSKESEEVIHDGASKANSKIDSVKDSLKH